MREDIDDILRNHEKRISRLEANMENINGWLKRIDSKLDKLSNDISYMRGNAYTYSKKNTSKKTLYTLIATQATTIFLLAMVLSKVI